MPRITGHVTTKNTRAQIQAGRNSELDYPVTLIAEPSRISLLHATAQLDPSDWIHPAKVAVNDATPKG